MPLSTRFAPSPTGRLHVGNARTALIAWLFARHAGGRLLLRIDDTDRERSRPVLERAIEDDLNWLGLDWDARARQSDRLEAYGRAFQQLQAAGRVYACYETAEELAEKRQQRLSRGLPPIYDRAGRGLGEADRHAYQAEGRHPHFRFALPDAEIAWHDRIQGAKRFHGQNLSDPVVLRADGWPTYLMASAVDDLEHGITDVIRGEDHVTNTAVQIALMEGLGGSPPAFAHLPLLVDGDGRGLSKRLGSLTLEALREQGLEPGAVAVFLSALGTSRAPDPSAGLEDLIRAFHLEAYGRAPPRFEQDALFRFNADHVRALSPESARKGLAACGLAHVDDGFFELVRPNLERLSDVRAWWDLCHGAITPVIEDPPLLAEALACLPAKLDQEGADAWLANLKTTSGRRGKALYRPLRLAITGREHGPPLAGLVTRIGRARVAARLGGAHA